jgi:hypothetical protein
MLSMITNIYNKKTKKNYFNGFVHSHRKTEKVFFGGGQLEMFDVYRVNRGAHVEHI